MAKPAKIIPPSLPTTIPPAHFPVKRAYFHAGVHVDHLAVTSLDTENAKHWCPALMGGPLGIRATIAPTGKPPITVLVPWANVYFVVLPEETP